MKAGRDVTAVSGETDWKLEKIITKFKLVKHLILQTCCFVI